MKKPEQNSGPGRAIFLEGTRNFFRMMLEKNIGPTGVEKKTAEKTARILGMRTAAARSIFGSNCGYVLVPILGCVFGVNLGVRFWCQFGGTVLVSIWGYVFCADLGIRFLCQFGVRFYGK